MLCEVSTEEAENRLLLDEYELQHFGFSSSEFIKQFKDAINYTVVSNHKEMEGCTKRKLNLSDDEIKILHNEFSTLVKRYVKKTNDCLKKEEQKIRNYFAIPQNILLSEDNIQKETAEIDEQDVVAEIDKLKLQYLKEKYLSFLYKEEIEHIDRTKELQEQLWKLLKQINKLPDDSKGITLFNNLKNLYQNLQQKFDTEFDAFPRFNRLVIEKEC